MDTSIGKSIFVYLPDGRTFEFKQFENGLYYFDTSAANNSNNSPVTDYLMLQTVSNNKKYFTRDEIKGADLSRKYQEYLFYPGTKSLNKYVANNLITNSAVTVDDINRGEIIYGPPVPYIQGHMTRTKPPIHDKIEKVALPLMIKQHHANVSLSMDFFYVNGHIFFHTKSHKVDFITAQYCLSRSLRTIITALAKVQHKYISRGFNITDYHGDNEFDKSALKEFLEPALLHIYGRNEHVGPIERSIRTIKERGRSVCNGIPYKRITILMVRSLIEGITDTINAFPSEGSISETISPSTIVQGTTKLDLSKDIIVFGAYALVYTDTNNNMKSRAVPGVALRRSNNAGGHYFMSLYSGKRIHGYKWKELPIDDYVVSRVEELAEAEKQPIIHDGEPNFEWAPGRPIEEILEDEEAGTLTIANHMENAEEYDHIENEQMNDNHAMDNQLPMENNNEEGLDAVIEDNIVSDEDDIVDPIEEEVQEDTDDDLNENADNHEEDVAIVANIDDDPEPINQHTSDRPRRTAAGAGVERLQMDPHGKGYTTRREFNLMNNGMMNEKSDNIDEMEHMLMQVACDVIFTQMSSKPELKKYAQMPAKQEK